MLNVPVRVRISKHSGKTRQMLEANVIIKPKREKPIINGHPWVFSGAIREIDGFPQPGDMVTIKRHDGMFLGRGYWNPNSQIQVRLLTWEDEPIDEAWWRDMLAQAISRREQRHTWESEGWGIAYRVINAENDYLPGLVVDRYGDWLVMQALTLGIDQRKAMIAELLAELTDAKGVYERSDVDVRKKEGLEEATGVLWGAPPPDTITIKEGFQLLAVDVRNGHKTGYYLDQANSRGLVGHLVAQHEASAPCRVLNLFSYTGGFGVQAMEPGNAHIINVDASLDALQLAEENARLNGYDEANEYNQTVIEHIQADVFVYLRDQVDEGELYDIVVLDPPKFAHNKHQIDSASRGYKDINLNAFKLVRPGGYLLTFSCSGAISADLFQKIVFGALVDSGRQAQIISHLGPGDDHPVALTFPEGAYLKGLLLRVY